MKSVIKWITLFFVLGGYFALGCYFALGGHLALDGYFFPRDTIRASIIPPVTLSVVKHTAVGRIKEGKQSTVLVLLAEVKTNGEGNWCVVVVTTK